MVKKKKKQKIKEKAIKKEKKPEVDKKLTKAIRQVL